MNIAEWFVILVCVVATGGLLIGLWINMFRRE